MRNKAVTVALIAVALFLGGCEWNGLSSKQISKDIIENVERICGPSRDSLPRGGVQNIMLMDGREDDGIVTCDDGTNHYFDG